MYIPDTKTDIDSMLGELSVESIGELFSSIPQKARLDRQLDIPAGLSEFEVFDRLKAISEKNKKFGAIFRGAGAYSHLIPSIVSHLSAREEFVTAYTPYQAEISQGVLQAIFEFQTMICQITGMDIANASVYDGTTAAVEAAIMCLSRGRDKVVASEGVHPQTIEVLRTYGIEVVTAGLSGGVTGADELAKVVGSDTACVIYQQPNFYGMLEDSAAICALAHENGALAVVSVNPISLGLLKPPGEFADIAIGEGQPLGIPLSFGGPYLGFMACKERLMRKLPGRIVGETVDVQGKRGYVLTLQAREQHIKRENAKSSICSNQAHCALRAAVYLAAMGPNGLYETARQCVDKAHELYERITAIDGFSPVFDGPFFNEFVTKSPVEPEKLMRHLEEQDILGGLPLTDGNILWCATEANTPAQIESLISALKEVGE